MRVYLPFVLLLAAATATLHAEPVSPAGASARPQATDGQPCPSARPSLRALRLQNAVQNGDLSPAEASKLLQRQDGPPNAGEHAPGLDASQPPHHRPVKHSRRYWRDQRQHFDTVSPPAEPD